MEPFGLLTKSVSLLPDRFKDSDGGINETNVLKTIW